MVNILILFTICSFLGANACFPKHQTSVVIDDIIKKEFNDIEHKVNDGFKKAETAVEVGYKYLEPKISDGIKKAGNEIADEFNKIGTEVSDEFKKIENVFLDACKCINYNCGCCAHLEEAEIHLNSTICTNITYLVKDYGISFTITVNDYAIYNETVSARNPPPVCLGVPYVKELADVCVRLYDINATSTYLHLCIRVEARMKTILIAKYELGCINLGPPGFSFVPEITQNIVIPQTIKNVLLAGEEKTQTIVRANLETTERPLVESSGVDETTQNIVQVIPETAESMPLVESSGADEEPAARMSVLPIVLSVIGILIVIIVAVGVYLAVKKRKNDQYRKFLIAKKSYGSTQSLASHMDPYC